MATPSNKLAASLEALHKLQADGQVAIRSADLSRVHRERLVQNGFLQKVVKGWYAPASPDETGGESAAWYVSFWQFCAAYLNHLKGDDWCLSPEQSIALHTENWTVPKQLLVRSAKARNKVTTLPHGTSLLDVRSKLPDKKKIATKNGLRIYSLPAALVDCGPHKYQQNPTDMRTALAMIKDASELLEILLDGGHSSIAGRLAGAFRNTGQAQIADEIVQTMRAASYDVRETDPFAEPSGLAFSQREPSPYAYRIRLMWQEMREVVEANFPAAPKQPINAADYLQHIEDIYVTDAWHSLSIEGYRVTRELIDRVREGDWNPDDDAADREQLNALSARGYWQAWQTVRTSIEKILAGGNVGEIVRQDHSQWYREMFAPGVTAGIHKPADLAGYRNGPVYIRGSMHVPPNSEAVRDGMSTLFELLEEEKLASVRTVLGHFIFVYIHPYMDGNGRMARFLMNTMLASGGYSWTVVPLEQRNKYMTALEEASVGGDIKPFAKWLGELVAEAS